MSSGLLPTHWRPFSSSYPFVFVSGAPNFLAYNHVNVLTNLHQAVEDEVFLSYDTLIVLLRHLSCPLQKRPILLCNVGTAKLRTA